MAIHYMGRNMALARAAYDYVSDYQIYDDPRTQFSRDPPNPRWQFGGKKRSRLQGAQAATVHPGREDQIYKNDRLPHDQLNHC